MILVDSSVWIDHFRLANTTLLLALSGGNVLQHPFVTAEIALGSIKDRDTVTSLLSNLPQAEKVEDEAMLAYVSQHNLHGTGLGMVDAHLLGSVVSGRNCKLWTRDKRLAAKAREMNCHYIP
jgi:predicted nucleic acid-binding protein